MHNADNAQFRPADNAQCTCREEGMQEVGEVEEDTQEVGEVEADIQEVGQVGEEMQEVGQVEWLGRKTNLSCLSRKS